MKKDISEQHITSLAFLIAVLMISSCESRRVVSAPQAAPIERMILGDAAPYSADTLAANDVTRIDASMGERRELAWRIVGKILEPVDIRLIDPPAGAPSTMVLSRWQTWFDSEDFQRIFSKAYTDLGKDRRRARSDFSDSEIAESFKWNSRAARELPTWSTARYERRLAELAQAAARNGLSGLSRTFYSPALVSHLMKNYRSSSACLRTVDPVAPDWVNTDPNNFTVCLDQEFPSGAVAIKAVWKRVGIDDRGLGIYDTSAVGLQRRFAGEMPSWDVPDGYVNPGDDTIVTMQSGETAIFQLVGMHIITKELRHWMWVTLWWSPQPDTDFGADRPHDAHWKNSPWGHYKMCAVSSFAEDDSDPGKSFAEQPSLAAALSTTAAENQGQTWCSNPYVEEGAGNARTNCIGCHQHAGLGLRPENIPVDETMFPRHGNSRVRQNFPADYLWSLRQDPENLLLRVKVEMDFHDVYDRQNNSSRD